MTTQNTHPSDRPRYRLVYPVFWMDPGVVGLTLEEKGVALYCLTGLQTNRIGLYKLSLGAAAEDLGITTDSMKKKFAVVIKAMDWEYDEASRVLFIPSWWRWNPARNPNILKGNLKDLDEVPATALTDGFIKVGTELHSGNMQTTFKETTLKRLAKRWHNKPPTQDQDQDQDQEELPLVVPEKNEPTKESYKSANGKILKGDVLKRFEQFLEAFDSKAGKAAAANSWLKIDSTKSLVVDELFAKIIAGAKRYAAKRPSIKQQGSTPKMAQGWLTDRRWEDEDTSSNGRSQTRDPNEFQFDNE